MRLLGRYLSRAVLNATLAVLLVIVGLDYIFTLLEELKDLTESYTLLNAVTYLDTLAGKNLSVPPGRHSGWGADRSGQPGLNQ